MLPDEIIALPVTRLVPTLRAQITADLASTVYAVGDQEWDRALQLLDQVKRSIGLLEACIEEMEQS